MAEKALSNHTYEDYLALEAESDIKYEFHDGFIVAMAGGSPEHSQIGANFIRYAGNALDRAGKSCIVHTGDLKVHIESTKRTFYPDVSIVCETPTYSPKDPNALTNPILILEVLSESTMAFDRGAKFAHYRQIPSLREYVLISQTESMVDTYYRTDDGTWEIQTITGLSATVVLKSLQCEVLMAEIYRLVPGME